VQQNAAALSINLTNEELSIIDRAFPAPQSKTALDVV